MNSIPPSDAGPRYIKQTAQRLRDDFGSDVPKTVDELCSLPGVGPKMAFLALQVAWNMFVVLFLSWVPALSDFHSEMSGLVWTFMFIVSRTD